MDMDMTMAATTAMADMAMSTATAMAGMAMSTASSMDDMTMDGMTMADGTSLMPSSEMAMVFFQSMTTPLYSAMWMPQNEGAYAGTCIFLIALAVIHQVLNAVKAAVFAPRSNHAEMSKVMSLDEEYATDKNAGQRITSQWKARPFRLATEAGRASMQVVTGGVGYLLMLAVMTMNIGYFISVLAGIFLGTFLAGRFGTHDM